MGIAVVLKGNVYKTQRMGRERGRLWGMEKDFTVPYEAVVPPLIRRHPTQSVAKDHPQLCCSRFHCDVVPEK